jgi:serine/threonine protein kinase
MNMGTRAEPELAAGARVAGRYRIEAPIARGRMGEVYEAVDESSGARVALKRRAGRSPRDARMFEREYHTLRGLRPPRCWPPSPTGRTTCR